MTHSVVSCVALAITTPVGVVIHTGDFKVDPTPTGHRALRSPHPRRLRQTRRAAADVRLDQCRPARLFRLRARRAYRLEDVFNRADNRLFVSCFSSSIHRLQQIIDLSEEFGRKVALVGRSMIAVTEIAHNHGFLTIPDGILMRPQDVMTVKPSKVTVLISGTQGEPMSALSRLSHQQSQNISIKPGDMVVLSSRIIPGNEKTDLPHDRSPQQARRRRALRQYESAAVAMYLVRGVIAADTGTAKMREIAAAIQEGAEAFLKRQFRTIAIIVVPLGVLVFFTATKVVEPDGHVALTFVQSGLAPCDRLPLRGLFSGTTGVIGMSLAVRGNVRTAAAARDGQLAPALKVAFRTGGVTGLFCVGLGLIGATTIVFIFQNSATAVLVGFGFGASLIALFMRVGGGIFTKAADVGADLVGKVEAGIPEDDPRNAATIADNVGDNVGDCAGMAADLFESYEITIIASLILGYEAFKSLGLNPARGLHVPAHRGGDRHPHLRRRHLHRAGPRQGQERHGADQQGFRSSAVLTLIGAFLVAQFYIHDLKVFWAVLIGVVLANVASLITEYFTSTELPPVKEIAESTRTGPATTVLAGISIGLESSVWAIIAIVIAIASRSGLATASSTVSLYLVALVGIGMLSTTGMIISEDSFGPVSDNAAGVAEMSGEFTGEAERVMVKLRRCRQHHQGDHEGCRHRVGRHRLRRAVLLVHRDDRQPAAGAEEHHRRRTVPQSRTQINVANPTIFIGLLIGGSIAFLFSSLAIRAVGRSAGTVVHEVRRQFREHPGIMDYTEKPEYGNVISICTAAAQRELATPALLAVCRRSSSALASAISPSGLSSPGRSSRASSWRTSSPTPAVPGTTRRSTSRTATTAGRVPSPTRRR